MGVVDVAVALFSDINNTIFYIYFCFRFIRTMCLEPIYIIR